MVSGFREYVNKTNLYFKLHNWDLNLGLEPKKARKHFPIVFVPASYLFPDQSKASDKDK